MAEPITLAEARLFLRLDTSGDPPTHPDDALVTDMIAAARQDVEIATGQIIVDATKVDSFDDWPDVIQLDGYPVKSITSVQYDDAAGVEQTLAPAAYRVDLNRPRARITPAIGYAWPATLPAIGAIRVTYVCGPASVSPALKAAIYRRLAELYENRNTSDAPAGAAAPGFVLAHHRMVRM